MVNNKVHHLIAIGSPDTNLLYATKQVFWAIIISIHASCHVFITRSIDCIDSYSIYIMGRVLQWIERNGGLDEMAARATKKANLIYGIIDESNGFYYAPVAKNVRSKMNIPFRIESAAGNDALEKEFLKGAEALGLIQLKGHR